MRLLAGDNNTIIIDDSYNASPYAVESALRTLGDIDGTHLFKDTDEARKIAVLGDMLELGRHTEDAHREIGKGVKGAVDVLCVVGPRAQFIKEGALSAKMKKSAIHEFPKFQKCRGFLEGLY